MECCVLLFLSYPKAARWHSMLFAYTRYIYEAFDKQHIQISDCAQYHPDLFYTLKPGECTFNEREFKSHYSINSMGLRDDESSLNAPEIIALGDSFTMGWGVDQNETFASVLEKQTGLKTLNAGIASYGTVREMILLSKLDLSNLKYFIIQYCPNDCAETRELEEQGRFSISGKNVYEKESNHHRKNHRYYPGRYSIEILKAWISSLWKWLLSGVSIVPYSPNEPAEVETADSCDRLFVETLVHFTKVIPALKQVQIIFVHLNLDQNFTAAFSERIGALAQNPDYPESIRTMKIIRSAELLRKDLHFYTLDDHMNAQGHAVIAQAILEEIRKTQKATASEAALSEKRSGPPGEIISKTD